MMCRFNAVVLALALGMGVYPAWGQGLSEADQSSAEVFSGTIEEVDQTLHKVIVKTDIGREVAFPVKRPELLSGLTKGERVTVQLDDEHTAIKIMKDAIPELKHPPTQ
jgi:hypothetical protein